MKHKMAQRHNRKSASTPEPGFGRMLTISVLLHVLIVVYVSGVLFIQPRKAERMSYKVNLVNKPVVSPRQGRPDVDREQVKPSDPEPESKVKPEPKPKPKPAIKAPAEPKAVKQIKKPAEKQDKQVQKKEKPKPAPSPAVQPQQPMLSAEEIEKMYQQDTQESIEEMRRKRDSRERIERLKEQLSADTRTQSPTTTVAAGRVGSTGGSGTQAGVDFTEWIKGYLIENWTLPRSHWKRDLYSVVELRFDSQGRRRGFRIIRSSGDSLFDLSVERAVTKLEKLPSPPGRELSLSVKFDPEEKY
jgi:TonB family protein